jgi:para-nitrobenzyl esterase
MAKGLFARAIAESGSGMGEPDLNRTGAERLSASFAAAAGGGDLAALRALSAEQVEAIADAMRPRPEFAPTVDGHVVLADPEAAGAPQSDLPLLTGYTADEGAFFLLRNGATTPEAFEAMVRKRYGAMATRFLALYPHENAANALDATRQIARDRCMAGLLFWAEARSRVGRAPIFLYLFDHIYPGPEGKVFRSFHTAEVPYVFGVLNAPGRAFTAKDKAIVRQMQDAWLAFMRAGAPPWRAFQRGAPDVMELGDHPGETPAVSTPERLAAFREFVASGGKLSFW